MDENPGDAVEQVRWRDVLAVFGKGARRQTALGVFLMGMQQLSGIDGVLYVRCFLPSFASPRLCITFLSIVKQTVRKTS